MSGWLNLKQFMLVDYSNSGIEKQKYITFNCYICKKWTKVLPNSISAKILICLRVSCRDKKYEIAKNQGLLIKKPPRKTSKPSKGYSMTYKKLKKLKIIKL